MEGAGGAELSCLQDRLEESGSCLSGLRVARVGSPVRWELPRWGLELGNTVEIKIGKLWATPHGGGGPLRKGRR